LRQRENVKILIVFSQKGMRKTEEAGAVLSSNPEMGCSGCVAHVALVNNFDFIKI
jgi:hypothetical protein